MAHNSSKEQFWRRTLADWQASGLSVRQYCSRHNLSEPSFYAWRRELPKRDAARYRERPGSSPSRVRPLFVPVDVDQTPATGDLEVVLANARTIRVRPGFDRDTLVQLVAVLEDRPC